MCLKYCLHLIVTLYYFKGQAESKSLRGELHTTRGHGHQNNNNDRSCLEKMTTLSAVNDYNKTITKHNDKKDTSLSFDAPEKDLNIIINTVDIEQKTNLKVLSECQDASVPSCVASMGLDVPVIDVKSLCLDNVAVIVEPNEFEVELTQDDSRDKEEDSNDKVETMIVDGDASLKNAILAEHVHSLPGINFVVMNSESSQEDSQNSESLRDESELENMLTKKWSQDARQERNKKIGKLRSRKHKLQSKSSVHDQFVDFDRSKEEFENSSRKARIDTQPIMYDKPIDDISENIDIAEVPMKLPRVGHGYDSSDNGNSKEAEDMAVAMDRKEYNTERMNVSDSLHSKLIDEAGKDTTASGVCQKNEMIESDQRPLAFRMAPSQTSSPLENLKPSNKPGRYIVYYIKIPSMTYHCLRLNQMQ